MIKSMVNSASKQLCKVINYDFIDLELLKLALTHRSAGNKNNERLEYLGDSILNFVISEELFNRFTDASEGVLTRMRAHLVRGVMLAEIAKELHLGDYLILGAGEKKSGGHQRNSILADTLESIIGAILLDSNFAKVKTCILKWYEDKITNLELAGFTEKDPKTKLQELLQAKRLALPEYSIVEITGEDHNQIFHVECVVELLEKIVKGKGSSRRLAEQQAAERAIALLVDVI